MKDAIDYIVIRRSIRQWQCAQSIVKADTHSVLSGRNVFRDLDRICALQSLSGTPNGCWKPAAKWTLISLGHDAASRVNQVHKKGQISIQSTVLPAR